MLITKNKKAYFDYEIISSWEAGIELFGHEVKSIRKGNINLKGSYISSLGGHFLLKGMHITPFHSLSNQKLDQKRDIKIFLHKKDIFFIGKKQKEGGYTIIPLEIYFKGSLIKVKVGLCKGRKKYEKKQILKEKTLEKEAKVMMKKINY